MVRIENAINLRDYLIGSSMIYCILNLQVNPSDMLSITGMFGAFKSVKEKKLPTKVGTEGAGIVEKVASSSS